MSSFRGLCLTSLLLPLGNVLDLLYLCNRILSLLHSKLYNYNIAVYKEATTIINFLSFVFATLFSRSTNVYMKILIVNNNTTFFTQHVILPGWYTIMSAKKIQPSFSLTSFGMTGRLNNLEFIN